MEEERISLGTREQKRATVLNQVLAGSLTLPEGAAVLGLSVRQLKRLKRRYRQRGPAALLHGNRGRPPWQAVLREQEDAQGYLQVLHQVVRTKGIPLGLYVDHHGIFQRHGNGRSSLEDELEASPVLTQVGRALQELGIQLIFAQSPQAKGRVERLWGTLQDRLGSELRLAQVTSLPEANQLLARYLQRFNRQFAVPARDPTCAYEPVPVGLKLDRIFCFKYERLVHADNTVRFDGREIQLLPLAERRSWVRARVEVHEHFDGAIAVYYRNTRIPSRAAPASATTIRARIGPRFGAGLPEPAAPPSPPRGALPSPRPAWKPPRTHPWKMTYENRFPSTGTKSEHA